MYDELISQPIKSFIDQKINNVSPRLRLHKDSSLSSKELVLRDTIEERMYPLTKYDPMLDNKADR